MGAHFTPIQGIFLAHALFDERVSGFAFDRCSASLSNQLLGVPGQPRVVNDLAAVYLLQELVRQQAHDVIAFDKPAIFVKEKTAVVVAVPGDPHVGPFAQNRLSRYRPVFLQQGIGNPVREVPVGFVMQLYEIKGQPS